MAPEGAKTSGSGFKKLLPIVLLIAVVAGFFGLGLNQYLSFEALRDNRVELLQWSQANQLQAITGFILIYAVVVALSLPGATWMTLAGGFIFGTVQATLYVVSAATLGALLIFILARYCLADFFRAKAGRAAEKMEQGFKSNALSYLLFLRLVPLFPFWLVNLVPAFLGVPMRTFIIGTFFGIIPGTAVFCSVGNGLGAVFDTGGMPDLKIIFQPDILGPILALAVLSLVPIVYKRIKGKSKTP
ncbi:MAG: TVP38/TMEM64 family protein [Rhodospirillales bacterium]|nr:TVP38/TMEM64 family protein [Rhodospirillales bacterium]